MSGDDNMIPLRAGFDTHLEALAQQFRSWLDNRSPSTQRTYTTGLSRFREYLIERGELAGWHPGLLTPEGVARFRAWLLRKHGPERQATVSTYLAGLLSFARFLSVRNLLNQGLTYDQLRSAGQAIGRKQAAEPLIDTRLPLIVMHVRSLPVPAGRRRLERLRDEALIQTLFSTGMRREEASALNRQDMADGRADRAVVASRGRKRMIFFDQASLGTIRTYLEARRDQHAPVFLRHDNHRGRSPGRAGERWRLSPQGVWLIVKRYAREAHVSATTRDFRNAKALALLERGASLAQVRDLLGQASVEATWSRYVGNSPRDLREVFDRYSSRAEDLVAGLESDKG